MGLVYFTPNHGIYNNIIQYIVYTIKMSILKYINYENNIG